MRTWLAPALGICVVAIVVYVILMADDKAPDEPTNAVEVAVEAGEVSFSNGAQTERVRPGEKVTAHPDGSITRSSSQSTPTPAQIEIPTPPPLPPPLASLTLFVRDTDGEAVSAATATIRQASEQYIARLGEDGSTIVEELQAGNVDITVSHPLILARARTQAVLEEGPNEVRMVVTRRALYSAFLKNKEYEPVTKGIVTLSPKTDGQKIKEADLSERSPNEEGLLAFDPVVSGEYLLSVSAPPYLPHEETVIARYHGDRKTIILSERAQITVTVQNEEAKPIGGAHVTLRSAPGSGNIVIVNQTNDLTGKTDFKDIPPGAYKLIAEHRWYENHGKGTTDLKVAKDHHSAKLTLAGRGYRISGRVHESESNDPVEGAVVVAYLDRDVRRSGVDPENEPPPDASAVSQSDGSYVLENLVGGTYFVVVSEAGGYITVPFFFDDRDSIYGTPEPTRAVLGDEQEASGVDLPVWLPWTVTGRLLLPDGRPATRGDGMPFRLLMGRGYYDDRTVGGDTDSDWMDAEDGDGSFEHTCMRYDFAENWRVRLTAASSGYGWSPGVNIHPKPGGVISGVELKLEKKKQPNVTGFVRDTRGQPIEKAWVLFGSPDSNDDSCWTGEDGSYHSDLPPGVYSCLAIKENFRHQERAEPLVVEENQTYENIDFVLEEGQEIFKGWVSEPDGTPVANLEVSLAPIVVTEEGHTIDIWVRTSTKTDENGRFELSTVMFIKRITHFRIRTKKTETYQEAVFDTPEWGAEDVHLVVERYEGGFGNIGGFLMDHSRRPVTRFDVRLNSNRPEPPLIDYDYGWRTVTHPEGMFLFERVPVDDGPFLVAARVADSPPVLSDLIPLQRNEVREDITIVLQQSFTVFGRIVGPDGNPITDPIAACKVRFWRIIPDVVPHLWYDSLPRTETAPDGSFRLDGIPVRGGTLRIFPMRWDPGPYQRKSVEVSIGQPGEERDLGTIVLEEISPEDQEQGP